ncbi:MAG TPA: hypothetical protein VJT49_32600 [Amycolatopsis sp.]|uniref:hypothetical protein n=1 Tax=Amycolatopsis sp. TaxID=37632 RepID=UPI002B4A9838|nr:hypothetical protein [Amycolatopsis sp.]HKS49764.1 hypothetical protein [Amycolatopsis sp.]
MTAAVSRRRRATSGQRFDTALGWRTGGGALAGQTARIVLCVVVCWSSPAR